MRVFQGETFRLVQDFKIEPDSNHLFYDHTTSLIYFRYRGQNPGFDAYERVSIMQAKQGARYDQLVADMIAPDALVPAISPRSQWTITASFLFAIPAWT